MRMRLRPAYQPDELARIYPQPHDHTRWVDHLIRVDVTVALARGHVDQPATAADLSCGDAAIVKGLNPRRAYLGDYAPGYEIHGPIEETVTEIPRVDVYVCSETIARLANPKKVLKQIRGKAAALVLSTPVDNWNDPNPEHYWAWSRDDVEEMLTAAGWRVEIFNALDLRPLTGAYCFGIWCCR